MSAVLVGPLAVRGRHPVRPEVAAAALGCLDDPLALLADRAVPVDDLLGDAVTAAVGPEPGPVTLVTPSWWPARRIARVARAARADRKSVV